jgi:membrane-associated phospholipid phosphatase
MRAPPDGGTFLNPWHELTAAGDSAVLLPLIVATTGWLLLPADTRRDGWRWALAACACGGGVALSKLLYMGWGLAPPGLDYTGISGHSAMSMLVWPTIAALLSRRAGAALRVLALGMAVLLACGVAVSRVWLKAHSVSEVILGSALGLLLNIWFLRGRPAAQASTRSIALLAGMTALIVLLCYGRIFPSQHILKQVALQISGHEKTFGRRLHRQ